ncbi:hypothetical protein [Aquipuribacter sp. SD81]|uniref:hypothetical protein n=1 Tax=Aquipuribacter sp. SD81 TaxID=3127703 RepID=UPI00301649CA
MGEAPAGRPRRWWLPGVLVALVATALTVVVAEGWYGYEAGGCGDPREKFTCMSEAILGGAAVILLAPPAVWLAYRESGVRRPFLSLLVALGTGVPLLAVPWFVQEVTALAGRTEPALDGPGSSWSLAVVVGPAVLAGGLAWSGPRRAARAVGAGAALVALVGSVFLLAPAAREARDERVVAAAGTPLVIAPGWRWVSPWERTDGLDYDVVVDGTEDRWDRLAVELSTDLDREGWRCDVDPCRQVGDVLVTVPDGGTGFVSAWRVLDGHLVEVTAYDPEDDPDPVAFLTAARVVDLEEFLAARRARDR